MRKMSALKLGLGALIALSTLVAPAATHAAGGLCIFSYTNRTAPPAPTRAPRATAASTPATTAATARRSATPRP